MQPLSPSFRGSLLVLTLLASALAVAPGGQAQAGPAVMTAGDPVLQLYMTGANLGGPMTTDPPTGTTSTRKSIIASNINPALGTTITIATFKPATDMTFTSDTSVSLWIVADTQSAYDQIQAQLVEGSTVKANSFTRLYPVAVSSTPSNVRITIPTAGQSFKGGTQSSLQLILFGASAAGTPTDLFLLYGSESHPTGFTGAVNTRDAFPTRAEAYPVFLDDKKLSLDVPTGTADKRADVPIAGCGNGVCFGSSTMTEYGRVKIPDAIKVVGQTTLTFTLGVTGSGGAVRGIGTTLTLGSASYAHSHSTAVDTWTSATATRAYRFSFPTTGAEVPAGGEIRFSIQLWSTTATPVGNVQFMFGSVGKPSGFMIPIEPLAPAFAVTLEADTTEILGPAGGTAPGSFRVNNSGAAPVNLTFNATGDLPVAFDGNETIEVAAGATQNLSFLVDLVSAVAGTTYNLTILALADGVELANLTVVVTATEPPPEPSAAPAPGAPTQTASAQGASPTSEDAGTPSVGAVAVVSALGAAAMATLRRRPKA